MPFGICNAFDNPAWHDVSEAVSVGDLLAPVRVPKEEPLIRSEDYAVAENIGGHDLKHAQALVNLNRASGPVGDGHTDRVLPLIEGNLTQVTANCKSAIFRFDLESCLEGAGRNNPNSSNGFDPESNRQ